VSPEEQSTRERIVLAAIEVIRREGLRGVTTRSIASEAGVNSAAVNYHFGTKGRLVDAALAQTLREAFPESLRELREVASAAGSLREGLRFVLGNHLQGVVGYRRITLAHLAAPLEREDYEGSMARQLQGFLETLADELAPLAPAQSREQLGMTLMALWSSVLFGGLVPGLFRGTGPDLGDREARARYVDHLLESFFPDHPSRPEAP
jgi:AcrR family transcriptional regulator